MAVLTGLALLASDARAGASLYDIDILLNQTYPYTSVVVPTLVAPQSAPSLPTAIPVVSSGNQAVGSVAPEVATTESENRWGVRSDGNAGIWGISEIRLGGLIHDEGPFSRNKEEGPDVNVEMLFVSPEILDIVWSPRPHIGADINTQDDTSSYYLGLSWEWFLWRDLFAGFSFGGAYHDGETDRGNNLGKKELGCPVLFRESVEIGWLVAEHHSFSLMLDHISNAKICSENEGLENFGFRYGYRF